MDASLNQRIGTLERRVRMLAVSSLVLLLTVVFAVLPSARSSTPETHLRIRSLAVVDEHGVDRILIAAPLPNPVSGGKESQRRSNSHGIQLNDAKGNEFGGFTIADDGALVGCFDWAQGEADVHVHDALRGGGLRGQSTKRKNTGTALACAEWGRGFDTERCRRTSSCQIPRVSRWEDSHRDTRCCQIKLTDCLFTL